MNPYSFSYFNSGVANEEPKNQSVLPPYLPFNYPGMAPQVMGAMQDPMGIYGTDPSRPFGKPEEHWWETIGRVGRDFGVGATELIRQPLQLLGDIQDWTHDTKLSDPWYSTAGKLLGRAALASATLGQSEVSNAAKDLGFKGATYSEGAKKVKEIQDSTGADRDSLAFGLGELTANVALAIGTAGVGEVAAAESAWGAAKVALPKILGGGKVSGASLFGAMIGQGASNAVSDYEALREGQMGMGEYLLRTGTATATGSFGAGGFGQGALKAGNPFKYIMANAAGNAIGGGVSGGIMEGEHQLIKGQFDPTALASSVGQGAAFGGLFGAGFAGLHKPWKQLPAGHGEALGALQGEATGQLPVMGEEYMPTLKASEVMPPETGFVRVPQEGEMPLPYRPRNSQAMAQLPEVMPTEALVRTPPQEMVPYQEPQILGADRNSLAMAQAAQDIIPESRFVVDAIKTGAVEPTPEVQAQAQAEVEHVTTQTQKVTDALEQVDQAYGTNFAETVTAKIEEATGLPRAEGEAPQEYVTRVVATAAEDPQVSLAETTSTVEQAIADSTPPQVAEMLTEVLRPQESAPVPIEESTPTSVPEEQPQGELYDNTPIGDENNTVNQPDGYLTEPTTQAQEAQGTEGQAIQEEVTPSEPIKRIQLQKELGGIGKDEILQRLEDIGYKSTGKPTEVIPGEVADKLRQAIAKESGNLLPSEPLQSLPTRTEAVPENVLRKELGLDQIDFWNRLEKLGYEPEQAPDGTDLPNQMIPPDVAQALRDNVSEYSHVDLDGSPDVAIPAAAQLGVDAAVSDGVTANADAGDIIATRDDGGRIVRNIDYDSKPDPMMDSSGYDSENTSYEDRLSVQYNASRADTSRPEEIITDKLIRDVTDRLKTTLKLKGEGNDYYSLLKAMHENDGEAMARFEEQHLKALRAEYGDPAKMDIKQAKEYEYALEEFEQLKDRMSDSNYVIKTIEMLDAQRNKAIKEGTDASYKAIEKRASHWGRRAALNEIQTWSRKFKKGLENPELSTYDPDTMHSKNSINERLVKNLPESVQQRLADNEISDTELSNHIKASALYSNPIGEYVRRAMTSTNPATRGLLATVPMTAAAQALDDEQEYFGIKGKYIKGWADTLLATNIIAAAGIKGVRYFKSNAASTAPMSPAGKSAALIDTQTAGNYLHFMQKYTPVEQGELVQAAAAKYKTANPTLEQVQSVVKDSKKLDKATHWLKGGSTLAAEQHELISGQQEQMRDIRTTSHGINESIVSAVDAFTGENIHNHRTKTSLDPRLQAYEANPTPENRAALKEELQSTYGDSMARTFDRATELIDARNRGEAVDVDSWRKPLNKKHIADLAKFGHYVDSNASEAINDFRKINGEAPVRSAFKSEKAWRAAQEEYHAKERAFYDKIDEWATKREDEFFANAPELRYRYDQMRLAQDNVTRAKVAIEQGNILGLTDPAPVNVAVERKALKARIEEQTKLHDELLQQWQALEGKQPDATLTADEIDTSRKILKDAMDGAASTVRILTKQSELIAGWDTFLDNSLKRRYMPHYQGQEGSFAVRWGVTEDNPKGKVKFFKTEKERNKFINERPGWGLQKILRSELADGDFSGQGETADRIVAKLFQQFGGRMDADALAKISNFHNSLSRMVADDGRPMIARVSEMHDALEALPAHMRNTRDGFMQEVKSTLKQLDKADTLSGEEVATLMDKLAGHLDEGIDSFLGGKSPSAFETRENVMGYMPKADDIQGWVDFYHEGIDAQRDALIGSYTRQASTNSYFKLYQDLVKTTVSKQAKEWAARKITQLNAQMQTTGTAADQAIGITRAALATGALGLNPGSAAKNLTTGHSAAFVAAWREAAEHTGNSWSPSAFKAAVKASLKSFAPVEIKDTGVRKVYEWALAHGLDSAEYSSSVRKDLSGVLNKTTTGVLEKLMVMQSVTENMNRRNTIKVIVDTYLQFHPGDEAGAKKAVQRWVERAQGGFSADKQLSLEFGVNNHSLTRILTPLMASALRSAENQMTMLGEAFGSMRGFKKAGAPYAAGIFLASLIGGGMKDQAIWGDIYQMYQWMYKKAEGEPDPLTGETPEEFVTRSLHKHGGEGAVEAYKLLMSGAPNRLLHKNMSSDNTLMGFLDGIAASKMESAKKFFDGRAGGEPNYVAATNFFSTTLGRMARATYELSKGSVMDSKGTHLRPGYDNGDAIMEVLMGRDTRDTDANKNRMMGGGEIETPNDAEKFVGNIAHATGITFNPAYSGVLQKDVKLAREFRYRMLYNWDRLQEQAAVRADNLMEWFEDNPQGKKYREMLSGGVHYGTNTDELTFRNNMRKAVMDYYSAIAVMQTFDELNKAHPGTIHGAFRAPGGKSPYLYRASDVLQSVPDGVFVIKRLTDRLNGEWKDDTYGVK